MLKQSGTIKRLAYAGVVVLGTGIGVIASSDAASAATACWDYGYVGESYAFWCNVVPGAAVHDNIYYDSVVDHLRTNPSYFFCRNDHGRFNGDTNGPHPYRWISTVGDDYGQGGWVSDKDIYSETDSISTCGY